MKDQWRVDSRPVNVNNQLMIISRLLISDQRLIATCQFSTDGQSMVSHKQVNRVSINFTYIKYKLFVRIMRRNFYIYVDIN